MVSCEGMMIKKTINYIVERAKKLSDKGNAVVTDYNNYTCY